MSVTTTDGLEKQNMEAETTAGPTASARIGEIKSLRDREGLPHRHRSFGETVLHAPQALRAMVRADEIWLVVLAAIVGTVSGLLVAAMTIGTEMVHTLVFDLPPGERLSGAVSIAPARALIVPVVGGLLLGVVGLAVAKWRPKRAVDPIEANALYGGRMSMRDSWIVVLQTMMSNGAGASVGLEAAYTQIGGGMGSWFGRMFRLRRSDMRLMVGCGTAAAIAGAFDAPLAGAFYAYELVIGTYSIATLAPVVVAAIIGTAIVQIELTRAAADALHDGGADDRRDHHRGEGGDRVGADHQLVRIEGARQRRVERACDGGRRAAAHHQAHVAASQPEHAPEPAAHAAADLRVGRFQPDRRAGAVRHHRLQHDDPAVAHRHAPAVQRVRLDRVDRALGAPFGERQPDHSEQQAACDRDDQRPRRRQRHRAGKPLPRWQVEHQRVHHLRADRHRRDQQAGDGADERREHDEPDFVGPHHRPQRLRGVQDRLAEGAMPVRDPLAVPQRLDLADARGRGWTGGCLRLHVLLLEAVRRRHRHRFRPVAIAAWAALMRPAQRRINRRRLNSS